MRRTLLFAISRPRGKASFCPADTKNKPVKSGSFSQACLDNGMLAGHALQQLHRRLGAGKNDLGAGLADFLEAVDEPLQRGHIL